tara:strand:- start:424 stop:609 length:186 start_codon:yes stop_codon:yes gene_type:complete
MKEFIERQIEEWQKQIMQQKEHILRLEGAVSSYVLLLEQLKSENITEQKPVKKPSNKTVKV